MHLARDDLVEQAGERLDQRLDRAGDEDGAVTGGTVLLDALDGVGARVAQHRVAVAAAHDLLEAGDRHPLVAAQEGADELAAVAALGAQVARSEAEEVEHLARPGRLAEARGAHPEVLLDDVGVDDGALEVEDRDDVGALGQLASRARARRPARAACEKARVRVGDRGEVHLLQVVAPSRSP